MRAINIYFIFLFLLGGVIAIAQESNQQVIEKVLAEGIVVDLRDPTLSNGVLSTDKGGVIKGPNIRIQAQKIIFIRQDSSEKELGNRVEAEGDLIIEFGNYIFVGDRLEYDFTFHTGVLYGAHSGLAPWFVGGEEIYLYEDESFHIKNGFITTSDNVCPDWYIETDDASFYDYRYLQAKPVRFRVLGNTLFWLPSLSLDLQSIAESPVRYTIGWGGKQGPRIGMLYNIFTWNRWKAFLRLDYRLKRGPGVGIETRYCSEDRREYFETINYVARDQALFLNDEKYRYRFQGLYHNQLCDDRLTIDLTYDKLSDKFMAIDYADQSLDIETVGRTELDIRDQEPNWIANLVTRVRINSFETVKQELPTLYATSKPFEIWRSGIISDYSLEASYLEFAYARNVIHVHNYNAPRVAFYQNFYKPINVFPFVVTPEAGSTLIYYGNSPQDNTKMMILGTFASSINLPMYRVFNGWKHVFTPYAYYQYYTFPTTSPNDHFIFDIDDGWYRLNRLRTGVTQSFYVKNENGCPWRYLYTDLYVNAFFDTKTVKKPIPKGYLDVVWNASPTLRYTLNTAWNFWTSKLDYFNVRTQWTASPDFAISLEYRYRSRTDWRKADRDNFILESFRSVDELLHSRLSDRRQVALIHFFYRFHPNWAIEYESRHGWHRRDRTRYNEFEIDLITSLRSSAQIRLSYQHRESEDRVAIYFSFWPKGPESIRECDCIPCVEF